MIIKKIVRVLFRARMSFVETIVMGNILEV
jgi:hypothetical protein